MNNPYYDEIFSHQLEESRLKRGVALVGSLNLIPVKDGNMWCYLLGEDLQSGIAGFGETPFLAAQDFEVAFCVSQKKLKINQPLT